MRRLQLSSIDEYLSAGADKCLRNIRRVVEIFRETQSNGNGICFRTRTDALHFWGVDLE
jgi:hypothetical protein